MTHPFPCLLDGLVVGVVAAIAGADGAAAVRLGVAMTALQASIGALNDLVDAPHDRGHKPGKPIPAGVVPAGLARLVVVAAAAVGLGSSLPSGTGLVALAAIVLAVGYAYDLLFKGTAWSWVPFALGIPLLPVFGWLGTTTALTGPFAVLLPVAVVAGAGLAIANASADAERDAAAGVDSVAIRLGPHRAWLTSSGLLAVVVAAAIVTLSAGGVAPGPIVAAAGSAFVIGLGVVVGRDASSAHRERAWELEAVGVGLLAAAWLSGMPLGR